MMFALLRTTVLVLALAGLALAPAVAEAAPREPMAKRAVARKDKGFGFLPGYDPPGKADLYGDKSAPGRRYWYRGDVRYGYGGARFYRGQWNGGSFGPCWTQTPAGPVWNCGK